MGTKWWHSILSEHLIISYLLNLTCYICPLTYLSRSSTDFTIIWTKTARSTMRMWARKCCDINWTWPLFYSHPWIVPASWHTLKLIVPVGGIQENMVHVYIMYMCIIIWYMCMYCRHSLVMILHNVQKQSVSRLKRIMTLLLLKISDSRWMLFIWVPLVRNIINKLKPLLIWRKQSRI